MPTQKFNKGDIVKIVFGQPTWKNGEDGTLEMIDMRPQDIGKTGEIMYSMAELQKSQNPAHFKKYTVKMKDGAIRAWFENFQLELA